ALEIKAARHAALLIRRRLDVCQVLARDVVVVNHLDGYPLAAVALFDQLTLRGVVARELLPFVLVAFVAWLLGYFKVAELAVFGCEHPHVELACGFKQALVAVSLCAAGELWQLDLKALLAQRGDVQLSD